MGEVFQFVTLMVLSHLLLGCLLVIVARIILRYLPLNAATRHNVWLMLLLILTLMPLISFTSFGILKQSTTPPTVLALNSPAQSLAPATGLSTLSRENTEEVQRTYGDVEISAFLNDEPPLPAESLTNPIVTRVINTVLKSLPLEGMGIALSLIIAIGIILKSVLFVRAYQNLRKLFDRSIPIDNEWRSAAEEITEKMRIGKQPGLIHSKNVNTPLTSGIFNPWIVLPTVLIETRKSPLFIKQILLHELAHIKRGDPLTASLQTLISVFMFWHPAIRYVSKQIRFERELACDDWIIRYSNREKLAEVQYYANSLLSIAESLQNKVPITHSVACVHTTYGLANRIKLLLDDGLDHSTSIRRLPNTTLIGLVLVLLITSSPLWPQIPVVMAEQASSESVSSIRLTDSIPEPPSKVDADPVTVPAFSEIDNVKTISSVKTLQLTKVDGLASISQDAADANSTESTLETVQNNQSILNITNIDLTGSGAANSSSNLLWESKLKENEEEAAREVDRIVPPEIDLAYEPVNLESITPGFIEIPHNLPVRSQRAPTKFTSEPMPALPIAKNSNAEVPIDLTVQDLVSADESIVIDDLTRSELRQEILKIETEFYRVFNVLVEDKHLKIHCGAVYPTGSHIRRHICEPNFVIEAQSAYAQGVLESNATSLSSMSFRADKQPEFGELTKAIVLEMKENKYLFELYNVLRSLKYSLEEIT